MACCAVLLFALSQGITGRIKQLLKEECVTAEQLQHVEAKIDGKLDSVDGKLESVDGKLESVDGKLESVEQNMRHVETKIDDKLAKIDTMEDKLRLNQVLLEQILSKLTPG